MRKRKIKALMVAPNDIPRGVTLPVSMKDFQRAVSVGAEEIGEVKARQLQDDIYILYHRYGCFAGLAGNRKVGNRIISGVFYVVATDKRYYPRSLTYDELQKYMTVFWEPSDFTDIDVISAQIDSFFDEYDETVN